MSAIANTLNPLRERFDALEAREQMALKWLTVFLLPGLVYFGMVYPVQKQRQLMNDKVANAEQQLQYVQSNVQTLMSLRGAGVGEARNGRTLAQVVADSARNKQLVVARLQPKNDNELQVWLEQAEFDRVLPWLYELETVSGVRVASASITTGDEAGRVRVSLKLKDGGA